MTRAQKRSGDIGQAQATRRLIGLGLLCVEKVGTPVRLIPARTPGTFKVFWGEKVAGDHYALLSGGRGVLVETKATSSGNLTWSDMRPHQPEKLTAFGEAGGLALLVWVREGEVFVMRWPVPGFDGPRKSITLEQARELDIEWFVDENDL